MSHVAAVKTRPGAPVFRSLKAVRMAADALGLEVHERSEYKWYGESVGDFPLPDGFRVEDMGKNATLVLSRKAGTHPQGLGYEVGIVADPNNPGCYLPMYDFYDRSLGEVVGHPVLKGSRVEALCPRLIQRYQMACDMLAAQEAGDEITFAEQADGSVVSVTRTEQRLGV